MARERSSPSSKGLTTGRIAISIFLIVLGLAALRDLVRLGNDLPWNVTFDLPDFYCAGEALNAGRSPYTYEPLRTCEHRVDAAPELRADPAIAMPAPQPPYDFPVFMGLAKLPYRTAQIVWSFAIVIALVATGWGLWRLGVPLGVVAPALVLSAGFDQIDAGQIVPFVLAALVLCGLFLSQRRDALAGVCGALTAIEPHLGAPVILATLLFVPRARVTTIVTGVLLAVASGVALGPSSWIVYVTQVLPAHASAEANSPMQFSFTWLLHFFAVPDRLTLVAGTLSFFAVVALGLVLAPRVYERLQRRELLVFLPASAAVTAGVFVHVVELCFALPAAIVFALYAPGWWRKLAAAAVAALAIPWIWAWGVKKLWLACVFVVAALCYRLRTGALFGITLTLFLAAGIYVLGRMPPQLPNPLPLAATAFAANSLVQNEWRVLIDALDVRYPLWLIIKLPAWFALTAILATAIAVAFGNGRQSQGRP